MKYVSNIQDAPLHRAPVPVGSSVLRLSTMALAASTLAFFILQGDAYIFRMHLLNVSPFLQVAAAMSLITVLWFGSMWNKPLKPISPEALVLTLCSLLYIASQVLSIGALDSLPEESRLLAFWIYSGLLVMFGYMMGSLIGSKANQILFAVLCVFVATMVIDAVVGGISESELWDRPASTLRNSNDAAMALVLLQLGALRWSQTRSMEWVILVVGAVGVSLTQSRGGFVLDAVLICCFLFWWLTCNRPNADAIKRITVAIAAVAGIILSATVLIYRRFGMDAVVGIASASSADDISAVAARTEGKLAAWELIFDSPFIGHGIGHVYTMNIGPHNMFLRCWVEAGLLGLLSFVLLLGGLAWFGFTRRNGAFVTLAALLAVASLMTHNLTESRSILIIIGVMLSIAARRPAAIPWAIHQTMVRPKDPLHAPEPR